MSLWLTISYSFLIITHIFAGITYKVGNVFRILPYFILCLFLVLMGDAIGKMIKIRTNDKRLKIKLNRLAYISIFGALLFIIDILRLNEISFGTRISDFQVSIIGVVGNILSSIGIIVWLKSLYEYRINNAKIPILSYISILSYVSGGILSAGRQAILLISIASIIMLIWSNRKKNELKTTTEYRNRKKRVPWGMVIILSVFISYFLFISAVRSGISDINNKMNVLESGFNAKISDETLKDVYQHPAFSDIYIESLFYYSHELTYLDLMYQNYDYYPIFGLFQLSYLERRLQWLFGNQGDISWNKVVYAMETKGNFGSHAWGTFLTSYIIDFGRFGALIACLITGLIFGIFYRSMKDKENSMKIIRHCMLLAGVVFSIQFSPLSELIWFFPVLFISYIKIDTPINIVEIDN